MSKRKREIWEKKVSFKIDSKRKRHHQIMVQSTFEPKKRTDIEQDPDINFEKLKQLREQSRLDN